MAKLPKTPSCTTAGWLKTMSLNDKINLLSELLRQANIAYDEATSARRCWLEPGKQVDAQKAEKCLDEAILRSSFLLERIKKS